MQSFLGKSTPVAYSTQNSQLQKHMHVHHIILTEQIVFIYLGKYMSAVYKETMSLKESKDVYMGGF